MNTLKIGDVVSVKLSIAERWPTRFTKDKHYIILSVNRATLSVTDNISSSGGWLPSNFIKVNIREQLIQQLKVI